jgi:hypothetical protein
MVDVHTQFEEPHIFQRITSLLIKTVIFYYLSGTFIGFSPYLIAGTILFALPSTIGIFIGNKLPRSTRLYRLLPTGTVLAVFLIFAGYFITAYIHSHFTNTLTIFSWTFVGVLIPVFIFQIADFFIIDKVDHWKESGWFYTLAWRAGGTAVYIVLVLIVFGVDIPGYMKTLIVG